MVAHFVSKYLDDKATIDLFRKTEGWIFLFTIHANQLVQKHSLVPLKYKKLPNKAITCSSKTVSNLSFFDCQFCFQIR